MKKLYLLLLLSLSICVNAFSLEKKIVHSYKSDYRLFPEIQYKNNYIKKLSEKYEVKYCVQSNLKIPRQEAKGYDCSMILKKLDQLGGLDKECYGVSYIDANTKERKPIFKKSIYDKENGTLYVKDKAAGGLNFDVNIDTYNNNGNVYAVNAIINKKPDNIFVRGIKKREAEIFVLMQEDESDINVYALIQCSYSPIEHKFLKSYVENAVTARVTELQNWFYRMLCEAK